MPSLKNKLAVIVASQPILAGMLRYVRDDAYVVAADAGWKNARALGLRVNLVVGDFDSSQEPTDTCEVIRLPAEKDDSDTFFAMKHVLALGCRDIVLLGAFGGRKDHELANMQLMLYAAKKSAACLMAGDNVELRCIGQGVYKQAVAGWKWLSVFAAGGAATGVCLKGVKYPLNNATLTPDVPLGLSNEFCEAEAEISCKEGYLYVSVYKDV